MTAKKKTKKTALKKKRPQPVRRFKRPFRPSQKAGFRKKKPKPAKPKRKNRPVKRKPAVKILAKKKPKKKTFRKPAVKKKAVKKKAVKKKAVKKKIEKKKTIIKTKPFSKKPGAQIKIKIKSQLVDSTIHKTKIRIIGIGGGGTTIVSEIASRIKRADFYAANTDSQALSRSVKGIKRFQFGQSLTRGLGTGMSAELGEQAAQSEEERIKKLLEGQDLCIIVASLGGGTSSGATPVFARISKHLGNITYGIFTLPFKFEGEKKMEMAQDALEKIKPNLNVYTVIPNERVFQIIDKDSPLREALSAVNKRLTDNLEGLIEMIYLPGLINIDFADLRTILSGRGRLTYLNAIEAEGSGKEEAIKKLISSPLYPYGIKGSRGILYNITSGKDIQLSEVHHISNIISESVSRKAKIIFGINQNPKYHNKTRITLLAAGCGAKGFLASSNTELEQQKKIKKAKKAEDLSERSVINQGIQGIKKIVEKATAGTRPVKNKSKKKKINKKKNSGKKEKKNIPQILKKKKTKPKEAGKKDLISEEVRKTKTPEKKDKIESLVSGQSQSGSIPYYPSALGGIGPMEKVRKNALQVRKEAEEAEKEFLEQEKVWEVPAILRRNKE